MKDDGNMARVPDLIPFCQQHGLPMVTVADLVAYRLRKDPIVRHLGAQPLATSWGLVTVHRFEGLLDSSIHLAFVLGDLSGPPPLVRVHLETLPQDLLGFSPSGAFHTAMACIAQEGRGVLVYLRRSAFPESTPGPSDREVGIGAQILGYLGVHEMRLLSRNEKKYIGLRGFGLDIAAHIHLEAP
jgi:3,4-dihydroxy 2-butanone 4-phosphate synthase/GTP cyclohydrolase II